MHGPLCNFGWSVSSVCVCERVRSTFCTVGVRVSFAAVLEIGGA